MIDRRPRLGFLGVGWIGRMRMAALHKAGAAVVAAIADVNGSAAEEAAAEVGGGAALAGDLEALLECDLDGVVIATPTALHAEQAIRGLQAGLPVFCQKPLGRDAAECRAVIDAARERDLLLGVDMSYRRTDAVAAALLALRAGRIGRPHAADLVFHNAYGPGEGWARDARLAGGGALMDLGCHLIDLAALFMGELALSSVHADLYAGGRRLNGDPAVVEDLALAQLTLEDGRAIRLACSWWQPIGTDAIISATFNGDGGSLEIRNVAGSFYDFETRLLERGSAQTLASPPDAWGGRTLAAWARAVGSGAGFDPTVGGLADVARAIDAIYEAAR